MHVLTRRLAINPDAVGAQISRGPSLARCNSDAWIERTHCVKPRSVSTRKSRYNTWMSIVVVGYHSSKRTAHSVDETICTTSIEQSASSPRSGDDSPFLGEAWPVAAPDSPTAAAFLRAVFSIRLPSTPVGATPFAGPARSSDADALHNMMQKIWTGQVLACFQTIWSWRHGDVDGDNPWDFAIAQSALRGRLLASLRSISGRSTAADRGLRHLLVLCRHLVDTKAPPPAESHRPCAEYVLFFDGGSRGNPGPGGAGAVVLRTDPHHAAASVVWSAAMSLAAPTTTNNQAEYLGLVTGLATAARNAWQPLAVVGDSKLIITQLSRRRSPKNEILGVFYREARSLADRLGIEDWRHHLRAYNKMADAAANIAMDGRCSIQTFHPTGRPEWSDLSQLLAGDFLHWQASGLSSLG